MSPDKTWSLSSFQVTIPEIYQIEVTNDCNFACPMCIREHRDVRRNIGYIDLDLVRTIAQRDLSGSYFVELQMSGEPLLHPKLSEVAKIVKASNVKVGLSTNGSLIKKQLDAIKLLDTMTISVDALDTYSTLRVGGVFETLIEGVETALELNPRPKIDLQVIDFWDAPSNLSQLQELAELRHWDVVCRSIPDCFAAYHDRPHPEIGGLCLNPWLSVSVQWDGDVVPCCVSGDTSVVTHRGVIPISEVDLGDSVLTHRGRFRKVTHTLTRIGYPIYNVSRKGSSLRVLMTEDHPISIGGEFRALKDVQVGDWVVDPIFQEECDVEHILLSDYVQKQAQGRYNLTQDNNEYVNSVHPELVSIARSLPEPTYGYLTHTENGIEKQKWARSNIRALSMRIKRNTLRKVKNKIVVNKEFLILCGYYLSEGWACDGGIAFAFHKKEAEKHSQVMYLLQNVLGVPGLLRNSKRYQSTQITSEGRSHIIGSAFRALFGQHSTDKDIPWWILRLPKEKVIGILEGFIKGDGCISEVISCSTSSSQLAYKLFLIFEKCGFHPSIHIGIPTSGGKHTAYSFGFNRFESEKLSNVLSLGYKRSPKVYREPLYRANERETLHKLTEKTQVRVAIPVYNLEVDEDNSYIIPYFGAVHNCFAFGKSVVYGNLNIDSLEHIWQSSQSRQDLIRRQMQGISVGPCSKCYMRSPVLFHLRMLQERLRHE